jgi:hypothetical protein
MPALWWGGIFTGNRYLSRNNVGQAFSNHAQADRSPQRRGTPLFAAAENHSQPGRD